MIDSLGDSKHTTSGVHFPLVSRRQNYIPSMTPPSAPTSIALTVICDRTLRGGVLTLHIFMMTKMHAIKLWDGGEVTETELYGNT